MLKLFLILFLMIQGVTHDLYLSITNINIDRNNTIHLTSKIDRNDLLKATGTDDGNIDPQLQDSLFTAYFISHFKLTGDTSVIQLQMQKVSTDNNIISLEFEGRISDSCSSLTINNMLLLNVNQHLQKNLVIVACGKQQNGLEFNYQQTVLNIDKGTLQVK